MANVSEIAPDVFRIATYVPRANMVFSQFLFRDDEPLLYHTGPRRMLPDVREAVARLIDPARVRWISFSHFEADECGSLNEWLEIAPGSEALCGLVGAAVNVSDFASRPPRSANGDEAIPTGKFRFRYIPTPQLPHGWDAGMLFEETTRMLLCSDLLEQHGDLPALTSADVIGPAREALSSYQDGPMRGYMPYTAQTAQQMAQLAALEPVFSASMHGSVYQGDGARALLEYAEVMREVLG